MIVKTFEIRDSGTFIPALAVRLEPETERDRYLLGRAGYGTTPGQQREYVFVAMLAGGTGLATSDPYDWSEARTMPVAHKYIIGHFDELDSGDVVDVRHILGETEAPCESERLWSARSEAVR